MALITDVHAVVVCSDCMMADAGYDAEELGRPYSDTHPPLEHFAHDSTLDVDHDSQHFGERCDGCRTPLAGDRYDAQLVVWAPKHVGHYSTFGTYWCDTCDSPYCELA